VAHALVVSDRARVSPPRLQLRKWLPQIPAASSLPLPALDSPPPIPYTDLYLFSPRPKLASFRKYNVSGLLPSPLEGEGPGVRVDKAGRTHHQKR
jgi:hypothetical protein